MTTRRTLIEVGHAPNEYATTDLYFASFLAARGVPLLTTVDGARCQFIFDTRSADLDALKFAWTNGIDDEVSATKFAEKVRQLKGLAMRRS